MPNNDSIPTWDDVATVESDVPTWDDVAEVDLILSSLCIALGKMIRSTGT